jgi:hypothetical protein
MFYLIVFFVEKWHVVQNAKAKRRVDKPPNRPDELSDQDPLGHTLKGRFSAPRSAMDLPQTKVFN